MKKKKTKRQICNVIKDKTHVLTDSMSFNELASVRSKPITHTVGTVLAAAIRTV